MENCHNSIPSRLGNELFVKFDRRWNLILYPGCANSLNYDTFFLKLLNFPRWRGWNIGQLCSVVLPLIPPPKGDKKLTISPFGGGEGGGLLNNWRAIMQFIINTILYHDNFSSMFSLLIRTVKSDKSCLTTKSLDDSSL